MVRESHRGGEGVTIKSRDGKERPYLGQVRVGLRAMLLVVALAACDARALADVPADSSVYVEMPDGVHLAVDVRLPGNLVRRGRVPALASFTRYLEGARGDADPGRGGAHACRRLNLRTALVEREGRVDRRPSYLGNTAENATFDPAPALKAAVPRFTAFDRYALAPLPRRHVQPDHHERLGPNRGGYDQNRLRRERSGENVLGRRGRARQPHVTDFFQNVHYGDQVPAATSMENGCEHVVTPYPLGGGSTAQRRPAFHWGSWMDAGTAAGVLARFASYGMPACYVIGAWTHGARRDADPFKPRDTPVSPSVPEQFAQIFEFFEPYVHGGGSPETLVPVLDYFTMGEDAWKRTNVWPPAGGSSMDWYFGANGSLRRDPPTGSHGPGPLPGHLRSRRRHRSLLRRPCRGRQPARRCRWRCRSRSLVIRSSTCSSRQPTTTARQSPASRSSTPRAASRWSPRASCS